MRRLGLTWGTVFDPCTNIAALGRVLSENFRSVADGRHPQIALRLALSMYNTGSPSRGFRNGYVAKVVGNAGAIDGPSVVRRDDPPSLAESIGPRSAIVGENDPPVAPTAFVRPPATWNVFEHAAYRRTALAQSTPEKRTLLWTR